MSSKKRGILNLSPRLGKTKIGIDVMKRIGGRILLAYPSLAIRKSWEDDFEKWGFEGDVTFTTYKSIHKYSEEFFDLVVLDEIHSPSLRQLEAIGDLLDGAVVSLGLTGTLSAETIRELYFYTGLEVVGTYSIEQAIADRIVSDYEIRVIEIPLDRTKKHIFRTRTGGKYCETELVRYERMSKKIEILEETHMDTFSLRIRRMQLLQNSYSKYQYIMRILEKYKDERLLLFCATTDMADSFGIPSYHSKKKEERMLEAFCKGEGKHLVAVKMLSAGITFKPLNLGIISCVDSNSENFGQKVARFLNYEFEGGKAVIYIISSDTSVEKKWIRQALEFLDDTKVVWDYKLIS
jgi:superfamily II DNA or RNA helicase